MRGRLEAALNCPHHKTSSLCPANTRQGQPQRVHATHKSKGVDSWCKLGKGKHLLFASLTNKRPFNKAVSPCAHVISLWHRGRAGRFDLRELKQDAKQKFKKQNDRNTTLQSSAHRNRTETLRSSWNTQGAMIGHPFISVPARLSRLALVSFSPRHLFKALSNTKKHPTPHGTEQFNILESSDLANLRHMRVPLIRVTTVRVEQGLGVTPTEKHSVHTHSSWLKESWTRTTRNGNPY